MKLKRIIATLVAGIFAWSTVLPQTLDIKITNLRNSDKGSILIALFVDEEGFKKEKEYYITTRSKSLIKNGTLHVKIDVEPGVYGVTVLDDENGNGKMDYRITGLPREGFGMSRIGLKCFKKPKFREISLTVAEGETKVLEVPMRYIL